MKMIIQADADEAARAGAKFIAGKALEAVSARGRFVMAVSGGHVPWRMFGLLAEESLPWNSVHLVQVDERVAPEHDPDRNLTHLEQSLISRVPLVPSQVHAMPVDESDLEKSAARYARTLEQIAGSPPVLDLVHLGLGPDGHTASLVPGDPVLNVTDRDVAITGVYQNRKRMTLTYPIINRARCVLWLITGADKRDIFQRLNQGDPSIPASRIRKDVAVAITERAAASDPDLSKPKRERNSMRIGIATDHGGFELKEKLVAKLRAAGNEIVDFGARQLAPDDDYPDFIIPLGQAVAAGKVDRGVAVCGSGVGATVCANKIKGVRACLIEDHFSARQGVEDDNLNLICLGGRIEGPEAAWDLLQAFLAAEFSNAPRHVRRLQKVAALETEKS
ncbi:MAG TPA: 6-phosphogluconolactonase [Candidatus Sulfotelmatobacter sp.]|nr:6-phosphogluconolactonase [Candidatus Sulfotelmatobacter sp.]